MTLVVPIRGEKDRASAAEAALQGLKPKSYGLLSGMTESRALIHCVEGFKTLRIARRNVQE